MRPSPPPRLRTLALCLALLAPAGVSAQALVDASDPAKVLEIARGFGSGELGLDNDGNPIIRARLDGTRYSVFFYGCNEGRNCAAIQFWTYFPAPSADPLDAVNAWNRDHRFAKAYIDADGDVVIEMDVNLWGGVTPKNLDDTFDWWRLVLTRARAAFGNAVAPPELPSADPRGTTL